MAQQSKLPPLPPVKAAPRKSQASKQVIYARNLNHMQQSMEDLMSDTLPTNYLYSKINVGEQAAHFFTETMLGADFDLRLREQFTSGFEALISANPGDANAVAAAQLECLAAMKVYDMIADGITQGYSARQALELQAQMEEPQGE